jgi:hypothetical protein
MEVRRCLIMVRMVYGALKTNPGYILCSGEYGFGSTIRCRYACKRNPMFHGVRGGDVVE